MTDKPTSRQSRPSASRAKALTMDDVQNVVITAIGSELTHVLEAIERSNEDRDKMWVALKGVAGLDGVAVGISQVAELLAPLKQVAEGGARGSLPDGVEAANAQIRRALGNVEVVNRKGELRPGRLRNLERLPTGDWESPVLFIGQT